MFTTTGRASRAQYFWHTLLDSFVLVAVLIALVWSLDGWVPKGAIMFVVLVPAVAYFVAEVCISVRRLHDLGRPGGDYLLMMVPLYNIYLKLVLVFQRGDEGPNEYGPDPLA